MSPSSQRAPAPARLGRYELQGVVGSGATGVVYRSLDPRTRRPVAIRAMRRDLLGDDERAGFVARLQHEAQAAAKLAHPAIVRIHEFGEDAGTAYLAMELVEGTSLRELVEGGKRFDVEDIVDMLTQLLDALQHAHERGVWHRDVKPANILVMSGGRIKLADFGIARLESSAPAPGGAMLGTPGYIAPEVYLGKSCDHRVDVFAAGAVAYRLLADCPPFPGPGDDIMYKVCYQTPATPSAAGRDPGLERYDGTVMRALAKRPAERYDSAVDFRDALRLAHDREIDVTVAAAAIGAGADASTVPGNDPRRRAPDGAAVRARAPSRTRSAPSAAEVARAAQLLTLYLGPIAPVLVRRAAAEAGVTRERFLQTLAGQLANDVERAAFLSRFG